MRLHRGLDPPGEMKEIQGTYFYKEWLKREGIPVIEDYYIKDVKTQDLKPWKRKGGLGVYLNLIGAEDDLLRLGYVRFAEAADRLVSRLSFCRGPHIFLG